MQDDLVPHVLETMSTSHIRVAVVGNVDAGKSTLIGTLISSKLDNGRGLSRSRVSKHRHEIESGRTSTVSTHLVGFDENGAIVTSDDTSRGTTAGREADIARRSVKTCGLMDLAGHERYLKTTVAGISRGMADYGLVLVNARQNPTHMTMHHLSLCIACGIPVIIVVTKMDACPTNVYRSTRSTICDAIRAPDIGKKIFAIRNEKDIETVTNKLDTLVPLMETSCVTGAGLDLLRTLIRELPQRRRHHRKINRPFEFLVEEIFNVTGIGVVLSGFVNAGNWKKGEPLFVGPMKDGSYIKTTGRSVHVAQTDVDRIWAGHSAAIAVTLSREQRRLVKRRRHGLVALKQAVPPPRSFTAETCLIRGDPVGMVQGRYQTTVHVLHLKKTVLLSEIHSIDGVLVNNNDRVDTTEVVLRPGHRARVSFAFCNGGREYVRKGMRIILRDGHVRGVGVVKECHA